MTPVGETRYIGLFRILVGLWVLGLSLPQLDHQFVDTFGDILEMMAMSNPWDIYRWLFHTVAIPHSEALAMILSVGQFLVGIALTFGFLTRIATLTGLVYVIIAWLASAHMGIQYHMLWTLLGIVFLALTLTRAGRYWGVDALWMPKGMKGKDKKPGVRIKNRKQQQVVDQLSEELHEHRRKKGPARRPLARR